MNDDGSASVPAEVDVLAEPAGEDLHPATVNLEVHVPQDDTERLPLLPAVSRDSELSAMPEVAHPVNLTLEPEPDPDQHKIQAIQAELAAKREESRKARAMTQLDAKQRYDAQHHQRHARYDVTQSPLQSVEKITILLETC